MPDKRTHRGPHPEDSQLFGVSCLDSLRRATAEFCWLLDRGYASVSALKLVGDRYQQTRRQRIAIMRCSCTAAAARDRHSRRAASLHNQALWIDGYNVLTTIEAALGGAVLLIGRDGCVRDMCSMHGTYRKVAETLPAARLAGEFCAQAGVTKCVWLLDSPVSNSGRLKTLLQQTAESAGWTWQIELVTDPDRALSTTTEIVATADSAVLDKCSRWFPLTEKIIHQRLSGAWIVDLGTLCEPIGNAGIGN